MAFPILLGLLSNSAFATNPDLGKAWIVGQRHPQISHSNYTGIPPLSDSQYLAYAVKKKLGVVTTLCQTSPKYERSFLT